MFEQLKIGDKAQMAQKFIPTHPDPSIGKSHGITLYMLGRQSAAYRNALARMSRRTKGKDLDFQDLIAENAKVLSYCCEGWEGVTDEKGKPVDFDRKKLEAILADDKEFGWLRGQCEQFIAQDDNFFQ